SGAQWTGVPAAWLLDEAGVQPGATWVLFEGADGASHTRSIPVDKVMDDVLLVYAQNGEMLRPEQGYPLRALIPGWEGNVSVKWLRRIKVGDQPWNFRSETARYTDPMPDGKWRQFSFVMECKSVITRPSGGMKLERPGLHEIQGFAWSGRGRITAVDVSADGGKNWQEATLEEPVLDKCLTRFRYRWSWDGKPAVIQSRAVDSTGYVQPTGEADLAAGNIDIRTSDGLGLPPGRGTAAEGRAVYNAKCVPCHGAEAKGGPTYGTMVGGIGSFKTSLRVVTPGSMYPYAPILFDYIRRAMPMDRPQTLTADEVYRSAER